MALDSSRSDPAGLDVGVAPRRSVRRRTVAAGLAWSVPVVLVGTPARAIAASSCPTLSYVLDASNPSYDEIRITNAGSTPLAAGTTITWVVYNRRAATSTLAIQSTTGVTAAPMFVGIASGGTGTITFHTFALFLARRADKLQRDPCDNDIREEHACDVEPA